MTPDQALEKLMDGNARFLAGDGIPHNRPHQVAATASGQHPYAIVLACIDSRVAPEIVFDTGIGDIFTACVAGNVVSPDVLGGMEFAVEVAGSKLIMILGHTGCGAIQGACDGVELGNLTQLLEKIRPAVEEMASFPGEQTSANRAFTDAVSIRNVMRSVKNVRDRSPIIARLLESGAVRIVGAMYDVSTGEVEILE